MQYIAFIAMLCIMLLAGQTTSNAIIIAAGTVWLAVQMVNVVGLCIAVVTQYRIYRRFKRD